MIVSVGEVVWDTFLDRQVLGGAPVNVAYHLQCLGVEVDIITAVGNDELGRRTKERLRELNLPLAGVQTNELPTGRVNVVMDSNRNHHFEIVAPAAWDAISLDKAKAHLGDRAFHMLYGTLSQRDECSRVTLRSLWEMADKCFYDVNLRPPFTDCERVKESLKAADVVKMNNEELLVIAGWHNFTESDKKNAAGRLIEMYGLEVLVITEGPQGAWLTTGDKSVTVPGRPVEVEDTVGAGDAFFAAFLEGYLNGRDWQACLEKANRRGGYVASRPGATPDMPPEI